MGPIYKFALLAGPFLAGCAPVQLSGQGAVPNPGAKASGGQGNLGAFEKMGSILDNPDQIFSKVGYTPLWTASQSEAASRLPRGLKVVPKAARVWESWFRKHLTNGGEPLSTAQLLQIKWTVAQTVANDPGCQFRPPQSISQIAKNVEKARLTALKSLAIDNPSSVITQMTRADASSAWVMSQRRYGEDAVKFLNPVEEAQKRYVTAAELNAKDYSIDCAYSSLAHIYLLREIEKAGPSGLKVGSMYVFLYTPDGKMGLHGINGVKVTLPGGGSANLYYDPTASGKGVFGDGNLTDSLGILDLWIKLLLKEWPMSIASLCQKKALTRIRENFKLSLMCIYLVRIGLNLDWEISIVLRVLTMESMVEALITHPL